MDRTGLIFRCGGAIAKFVRNAGKVVATSAQQVLEEYLSSHQLLDSEIEGRLVVQIGIV